jgi:hypothetical protein
MQVRMKVSLAYYDNGLRSVSEGEVVDLPDADAKVLIENGSAEPVVAEQKPKKATAPTRGA